VDDLDRRRRRPRCSPPLTGAITRVQWSACPESSHEVVKGRNRIDERFRRRINRQLNKGESIHALRGWLVFVEDGRIWMVPASRQAVGACSASIASWR
jgi:hypothetical protein